MDREQLLQMIRAAQPSGVTGLLNVPKDVMQRTPIVDPAIPGLFGQLQAVAGNPDAVQSILGAGQDGERRQQGRALRIRHEVSPFLQTQLFPLSALGGLGVGGLV